MNITQTLRDKAIILCLLFFFLALSVSAYASIAYPKPIGVDILFHLDVVDAYLRGENGMFAAHVMEINHMPYPPLFHMMLLPFRALGLDNGFIRLLQALMYPGCLLFALLLVRKYGSTRQVLFLGLALLGSMAYVDATLQIRPETFDVLFFLILVYATLKEQVKLGVASAVLGIYNHSFGSIALNGGALLFKRNWKRILAIAVLASPIIVITFMYIPSMFGKWVGAYASPQARQFCTNWLGFTVEYLGALLPALPIAVYEALRWKTLSPLNKIMLLTVASSLIMVPIWYDRYYHYVSIPLAVLLGDFCSKRWSGWRSIIQLVVIGYVVVLCLFLQVNLLATNLLGYWDFH